MEYQKKKVTEEKQQIKIRCVLTVKGQNLNTFVWDDYFVGRTGGEERLEYKEYTLKKILL